MAKATKTNPLHVVTDQDLIDNPEWVTNGIKVGDEVDLNSAGADTETAKDKTPKSKSNKTFAIVTPGGEFIRMYKEEALAKEFTSKAPEKRSIVDGSTITMLNVTHDVLNKTTGVISKVTEQFSFAKNGESWIEDALTFKNENNGVCKYA